MPAKTLAFVLGALVLAVLVGTLVVSKLNHPVSLSYTQSDVVYGKPLHVINQMIVKPISTPGPVTDFPSSTKPQLIVPETFYDFGLVGSSQVVTRVFEIANQGAAPLRIVSAHTTCICTTADLTSTEVPSGKVALMTVRFDPGVHNLSGQTVRRGVIVETNDPQYPTIEFWIQAMVK